MVDVGLRASINMETSCGVLLGELEHIWTEIGESDSDKDRMLLELEMECMQVYRKKVEEASNARARLQQSLMAQEAELATLVASLGEHTLHLQDENRYSAGRGSHVNLKRAEKARVTVTKIPAIVDSLVSRTFGWEDERKMYFLYDGVLLVSVLEEYTLSRRHKEEENRRFRDQKKLQNLLLTEKELMYEYESKPSPKSSTSFNRKANGYYTNGNGKGFMTPPPRRVSTSGATPELLTPRSHSGCQNGYFREMWRLSTAPLKFVAISKEDAASSFASISGSEPGSPGRY